MTATRKAPRPAQAQPVRLHQEPLEERVDKAGKRTLASRDARRAEREAASEDRGRRRRGAGGP